MALEFQPALHRHTPSLASHDPRGAQVRVIRYWRVAPDAPAVPRCSLQRFNASGRLRECLDPRLALHAGSSANLVLVHSLSGSLVLEQSADAGWSLQLLAEAGPALNSWDERGVERKLTFDGQMRPLTIGEALPSERLRHVERFTYGGMQEVAAERNASGRLIRHDDPAGTVTALEYALQGTLLAESRQFLEAAQGVDWPEAHEGRDALLEGAPPYLTSRQLDATAGVIRTRNAAGASCVLRITVDGKVRGARLTFDTSGKPEQPLVGSVDYDAMGQIVRQRLANGVVLESHYDAASGQLSSLTTHGHQHLQYGRDPVGNVLWCRSQRQATRWFRNQRIDPVDRFRYDTLYQLAEASGREVAGAMAGSFTAAPLDPQLLGNYTETYQYDEAGNLLSRRHVGSSSFTRHMQVATASNRSIPLPATGGSDEQIAAAHDMAGNLVWLQGGQRLHWNERNQLASFTTVSRVEAANDDELYLYDGSGQRVRKVARAIVAERRVCRTALYLPGVELRADECTGERQWVVRFDLGRCSFSVRHWLEGQPKDIADNLISFSVGDATGSIGLELDGQGQLLSEEGYHPFGTTAWWTVTAGSQGGYRTVRYGGKERDASGLYYYGARYYVPSRCRWLSPDPAKDADGLNRYRMVGNNPTSRYDPGGRSAFPVDIFIADIVNPLNASLGTGWYEELVWQADKKTFAHTGVAYGRGMDVISQGQAWPPDAQVAYALFRDSSARLRLFISNHEEAVQQHLAIQPQMGMPLLAGTLEHGPRQSVFDNASGHYKPDVSEAIGRGYIAELAENSDHVRYVHKQMPRVDQSLRMDGLNSPEAYADTVNSLKGRPGQTIAYLKAQGLWDAVSTRLGNMESVKRLIHVDRTGGSLDSYSALAEPQVPSGHTAAVRNLSSHRRSPGPLPPNLYASRTASRPSLWKRIKQAVARH